MNALEANHAKDIKDKNMLIYTNSVKADHTRTKFVALTFYFE
jgi:hypothetical protein